MTAVKIKVKGTKTCVLKKLNIENYKNCSEATQLENKLNHVEKNKVDKDGIKEHHKNI